MPSCHANHAQIMAPTTTYELPAHLKHYLPFLVSLAEIFSNREIRALFAKAEKTTLQVGVCVHKC